jgi:hypothetical protein
MLPPDFTPRRNTNVRVTIARADGPAIELDTAYGDLIERDPGRVVVHIKDGTDLVLSEDGARPLTEAIRDMIARGR